MQEWNISEQSRYVAQTILIAAKTKALLSLLETSNVRTEHNPGQLAYRKRLSKLSAEAIIQVQNMRPNALKTL